MRSILVTRPEPAGSELAARLRREGFETHLAPLSRYVPVDADLAIAADCQALVFTSAQGVAQYPPPPQSRDTTVFAVGAATAEAAQQAGFAHVITAGGDVRDLAQTLIARKADLGLQTVLHVSGEDTAEDLGQLLVDSGIIAHRRVVYRTEFIEQLPPEVERALVESKIDTVLLFSARAAQHWLKILSREDLRAASAKLEAVCLSERVAAELRGTPWRAVKVAKTPQVEAMFDILRGADSAPPLPMALPADPVIDIFGGIRPLANRLGITASTVQGWKKRGIIPDTRVEAIYTAAEEDNIDINALLAKGQYKMTMDDAQGRHPGAQGSDRRGPDRRQQRPAYDAHGNIRSATYSGPDRRTGVDRRAHQARVQQRVRDEKMRFVTRTVLMAAFFIGALALAGTFVMAPEFFSFAERRDREKEYEHQLKEYEDQIRELQKRQNELRRQQGQAPLPLDEPPVKQASPGIGQRMNQGIGKVQGAVETVKTTVSGTIEGAQKTVQKSDTYQGFQSLMRMLAMLNGLTRTQEGAAEAEGMMGRLRTVMAGAPNDPDGLSKAVEQAQKTDPTLQKVMGGVAPKDLGAAAMLLTMNELRGNIGGGQSFENDLKIIEKYASDDPEMQAALKRVAPYARSGVLSRQHLQKEFRNIAADIVMAKLQGEDASVRERVLLRLSKYAKMRKVDDIQGDSVDATVARAELLIDQGDIKGAIRELQSLEGPPAETASNWMQQAEGHVAADDSSQILLQTVLGMLGNGGGSGVFSGFGGGGGIDLGGINLNSAIGDLLQQMPSGDIFGGEVPGLGGQTTVPYLSPSLQQQNYGLGNMPQLEVPAP